jgi:hypothetical protein
MSLINDALKRASAPRPATAADAAVLAPLQPVLESTGSPGALPLVLCIVGVGSLLMAGAFWLKSNSAAPQVVIGANHAIEKPAIPAVAKQVTPPISAPVVQNAPVPIIQTELAPMIQSTPVAVVENVAVAGQAEAAPVPLTFIQTANADQTPRSPASQTVETRPAKADIGASVAPVTAAKPKEPELKLQAVYFRMKGPTVIINGKTLKLGDTISGAKLTGIERNAAEIEIQGVRRRLALQ